MEHALYKIIFLYNKRKTSMGASASSRRNVPLAGQNSNALNYAATRTNEMRALVKAKRDFMGSQLQKENDPFGLSRSSSPEKDARARDLDLAIARDLDRKKQMQQISFDALRQAGANQPIYGPLP